MRDYAPTDATLHGIADRLQAIQRRNFYQLAAEASHRGRYYHEYTMSIDVTRESTTWQPPTEDAEETVTEALRAGGLWALRLLPPLRERAFGLGMGNRGSLRSIGTRFNAGRIWGDFLQDGMSAEG